MTEGKVKKKSL